MERDNRVAEGVPTQRDPIDPVSWALFINQGIIPRGWRWCPDCSGEGVVTVMAKSYPHDEYSFDCERCGVNLGIVQEDATSHTAVPEQTDAPAPVTLWPNYSHQRLRLTLQKRTQPKHVSWANRLPMIEIVVEKPPVYPGTSRDFLHRVAQ